MAQLLATTRDLTEQWAAARQAGDAAQCRALEDRMHAFADLPGVGLEELEMLAAVDQARDRVDLRAGERVAAIDEDNGLWLRTMHGDLVRELAAIEPDADLVAEWRETADIISGLGEEYYLQVLTAAAAEAIVALCRAGAEASLGICLCDHEHR